MEYMNNKALADSETSLKFAMLFSSRSFDALAMNDTKVRHTMLKILETNFINAEMYRTQDRNRLYNSITMLGEYYHRVRLADNSPVKILGKSLLSLLQQELNETQNVDVRLAKLILSQVTLNGPLLDARHQPQLLQLFYYIRRQLIEQATLTSTVKALLFMTLDMYYSNFNNLSKQLEDLYTKYFLQGEQEEAAAQEQAAQLNSPSTNGKHSASDNNSFEEPETTTTKKWSEQVCEDSYENAFGEIDENAWNDSYNIDTATAAQPTPAEEPHKPMPRWRAPRFNREAVEAQHETRQRMGRRLSGNYDDDQQSVRSEGGSIRLYSITDRLKHSQEKIASSVGQHNNNQHYYNKASIANSNWDRQSQRDDRSERSYMSNYERGQAQHAGRHFNNNVNKQSYDKPPRFQKQQQQQQKPAMHMDSWRRRWPRGNSSPRDDFNREHEEHSRSRTLPRAHKGSFEKDEQTQLQQQQIDHVPTTSYRRRSSQSPLQFTRTRNYRQHNNNNNNNNNHNNNNHHPRYSSQSNLASEASSVYIKRQQTRQFQSAERQLQANTNTTTNKHQHRNYNNKHNYNNNNHNKNGVLNTDKDWNNENSAAGVPGDVDGEIVKNARQTAKYMNYLSQK